MEKRRLSKSSKTNSMKKAIILSMSAIILICAGGAIGRYVIPAQAKASATDLYQRDSMAQVLTDSIASYQTRSQRKTAEYIAFMQTAIDRVVSKYGEDGIAKADIEKWRQSIEDAKAGRLDEQIRTAWHVETMKRQIEILKSIR